MQASGNVFEEFRIALPVPRPHLTLRVGDPQATLSLRRGIAALPPWRLRHVGYGMLPMPYSLLTTQTVGFVQRTRDDTPYFERVDVLCEVVNPRTARSAGSLIFRYYDFQMSSMGEAELGFDGAVAIEVAETLSQRAEEETDDPILAQALREASLVAGAIEPLDERTTVPVGEAYILDAAAATALAQSIVHAREFGVPVA